MVATKSHRPDNFTRKSLEVILDVDDQDSPTPYVRTYTFSSMYAYQCCVETPEGEGCGLTKHLALLCRMSRGIGVSHVTEFLHIFVVEDDVLLHMFDDAHTPPALVPSMMPILVNGSMVGVYEDRDHVNDFVGRVRNLRRQGKLLFEVSVYHDTFCIHFQCSQGRMLRPVYVLSEASTIASIFHDVRSRDSRDLRDRETNNENMFWKLVKSHAVEFVSVNEVNNHPPIRIASTPTEAVDNVALFTHIEVR